MYCRSLSVRINLETHFAIIVSQDFLGPALDWVQLTSVTWNVTLSNLKYTLSDWITLGHIISVLKRFRPPNLRNVAVVFQFSSFGDFLSFASQDYASNMCAELDDVLVTIPQPAISFSSRLPITSLHHRSWMDTLEGFFPALAEHGVLKIVAKYCKPSYYSSTSLRQC